MSGNVIYGIDLNPAFKPRAIIQSRSLFPSFSTSATRRFPPRLPRLRPPLFARSTIPQGHVRYSIYIYLGTYPSYSRGTRSRIMYMRIANSVDSLRPRAHCLLRLPTDFFMRLSAPLRFAIASHNFHSGALVMRIHTETIAFKVCAPTETQDKNNVK